MRQIFTYSTALFLVLLSVVLVGCGETAGITNPKGIVTSIQRMLFYDALALILIIVIPVIIMSVDFTYHYREQNHREQITGRKVEYQPEWAHSWFLESLWWGVPCVIIIALASMTWFYTHSLDPYAPFKHSEESTKVQVIALPWKWLFIYPDYNIATINELVLPNERQTEFVFTNDNVPMSAFSVPQLGSQIYTMAGMQTKLHLIPTETGTMKGLNTQYNGDGFSGMHFKVHVYDFKEFEKWADGVKNSKKRLYSKQYSLVREPEMKAEVQYFSRVRANLFHDIIMSYHNSEHPTW